VDIMLMIQADMLAYHSSEEPMQLGLPNRWIWLKICWNNLTVPSGSVAQWRANLLPIYPLYMRQSLPSARHKPVVVTTSLSGYTVQSLCFRR
jgi:hypothetical protein